MLVYLHTVLSCFLYYRYILEIIPWHHTWIGAILWKRVELHHSFVTELVKSVPCKWKFG